MANYVDVLPELIRWAIDRSGLPAEDFGEQVAAWAEGKKRPTMRQLREFAHKAMVPFGYLFLSQPPLEELPVPDFRTRGDQGVRRPSPNLLDTIFQMKRRQEWMRDYLVDLGCDPLDFVGSAVRVNVSETLAGGL